ncbi:hypothetical protein Tco_1015885 [Tanacetum coccineum]|uniref:Xylulose kinase-1 n=1 Tax=Tanacetum coccineum TaxID=301880 RepID=A0ABQ5FM73_9ASTR
MTTLQFVDTHNLVVFLSKPAESEGFEQIVDFLNTNPIRYALTINPIIYTSCIEQFWATIKVKTVNGEVQLQALVDGKKIIVTEAFVRSDLQLNDEEGMDCLPNATIFEELTRMGYEKVSQKLTFYKAFFSPQWKFLIHTILQCLSAKTTAWNKFSSTMASGKGFSGRVTPLFLTMMVQAQEEMGKGSANPTDPHHTPTIIQPSKLQPQKTHKPRRSKRKDTEIPQSSGPIKPVVDEAVYKGRDDSLVRATTTVTSLDAEQDRGNINKMRSKATPNEPSSPGTSSGGGPRRQEPRGIQLLKLGLRMYTNIPMILCSQEETTKTAQPHEITSLKLRVKKLEKKAGSRTHKLKILYKVGRSTRMVSSDEASLGDQEDASKQERKIDDIDKDAEITLVDETQGSKKDDVVSTAVDAAQVSTAATTVIITPEEITLAQALQDLKAAKPKAKIQEKGKTKMSEPEPLKKLSKKDQLKLDEEVAQRLQAREQEELTIEERAKLFQQLLEKRRKFFAAKRAEEMRNKPPTRAQQRSIMCTYLKNMEGKKVKDLKNKTELMKESFKKAKVEITQKSCSKRANTELEQEKEVVIDAIPLATKPPSIVDYKIYKEWKKTYYQIIRADGSSKIVNAAGTNAGRVYANRDEIKDLSEKG